MNLRETYRIYATLMRRGMPEHPWLHYAYGPRPRFHLVDTSKNTHVLSAHTAADDSVAHDLIAMHALRWALGRLDSETARNAAYLEVFSDGSCVIERGCEVLGESDTDILAAILAATEHLEPKGDDDAKRP